MRTQRDAHAHLSRGICDRGVRRDSRIDTGENDRHAGDRHSQRVTGIEDKRPRQLRTGRTALTSAGNEAAAPR